MDSRLNKNWGLPPETSRTLFGDAKNEGKRKNLFMRAENLYKTRSGFFREEEEKEVDTSDFINLESIDDLPSQPVSTPKSQKMMSFIHQTPSSKQRILKKIADPVVKDDVRRLLETAFINSTCNESIENDIEVKYSRNKLTTTIDYFTNTNYSFMQNILHHLNGKHLKSCNLPSSLHIPNTEYGQSNPIVFRKFKKEVNKSYTTIYKTSDPQNKLIMKIRLLSNHILPDYERKVEILNYVKDIYNNTGNNKGIEFLNMIRVEKEYDEHENNLLSQPKKKGKKSKWKNLTKLDKILKRKRIYIILMKYEGVSLDYLKKNVIDCSKISIFDRLRIVKIVIRNLVQLLILFCKNQCFLCDAFLKNYVVSYSLKPQVIDEEIIRVCENNKKRILRTMEIFDDLKLNLAKCFFLDLNDFLAQERNHLLNSIYEE